MPKTVTIPESFPETLPRLWDEICRIAVDVCSWAVHDPAQRQFLESADSPRIRMMNYHQFSIPKKSGGQRTITAPTGYLKGAQKAISLLLASLYDAPDCVNGFAPGRSVRTNADLHIGKNYVFNTDIRDFFSSITAAMVRKALAGYGVSDEVAHYISMVCTVPSSEDDLPENVLAQGSPASPVLSNMVCSRMDRDLEYLARKYGLTYSRYADDITFSSMHSVYSGSGAFMKDLREAISRQGFSINDEKTRLQKKGDRQEVTGVVVSDKANVSRKYIKNLRAEIFQMEMSGFSKEQYRSVRGKVAYLGMVRGKEDGLYRRLRNRIRSIRYFPMGMAGQNR